MANTENCLVPHRFFQKITLELITCVPGILGLRDSHLRRLDETHPGGAWGAGFLCKGLGALRIVTSWSLGDGLASLSLILLLIRRWTDYLCLFKA